MAAVLAIALMVTMGVFSVNYTHQIIKTVLQARVVGQEKLAYFFDFVGYAWTDRVNTLVAPPADTAWLEASGTTLRIHVNGTTYTENYPFSVYAANTTNPTCLNIRYTAGGVYIVNVEEALCSWRAS